MIWIPDCKCGHSDLDHGSHQNGVSELTHAGQACSCFRPCFDCGCLEFIPEERN